MYGLEFSMLICYKILYASKIFFHFGNYIFVG